MKYYKYIILVISIFFSLFLFSDNVLAADSCLCKSSKSSPTICWNVNMYSMMIESGYCANKKNKVYDTATKKTNYTSLSSDYTCSYKKGSACSGLGISNICGTTTCAAGKVCLGGKRCYKKIGNYPLEKDCKEKGGGLNYIIHDSKTGDCYLSAEALKKYEGQSDDWIKIYNEIKPPKINIKIPGLDFSSLKSTLDDEGYIHLPYLGQYLVAVYKFAMAAASVLAVIMVLMIGSKIITSGGGEGKVEGMKKLGKVFLGLSIAWGSYAILYNINPDLVEFKALKIKYIQREEILGERDLHTTLENTMDVGVPVAGKYTPTFFTNCPISLSAPLEFTSKHNKEARNIDFYKKIKPLITGKTNEEKIKQSAEAALSCKVHLGSCGQTVGTIYALSGIKTNVSCLTASSYNDSCVTPRFARVKYTLKRDVQKSLWPNRCNRKCFRDGKLVAVSDTDCYDTNSKATALAVKKIVDSGALDKGWPDKWANELKPGDSFWVYNGNTSCGGSHAALFLGWAKEGHAQVIQGQASGKVWYGTICIKTNCGEKIQPLIKTFRP
jgi:hypothetical protein